MGKPIAAACLVAGFGILSGLAARADAVKVGAMEQVERTVYGTPPAGSEAVKRKGDGVQFQEQIETLDQSRALVRFIDGSDLSLGSKTTVLVDDFVFDPSKAKGNALIKLSVGTLRFVTGAMPKGGTVIKTPTATLTLRGTDVTVHVHPDGTTDTSVTEGRVDAHNDVTGDDNNLGPGDSQTSDAGGNHGTSGDDPQGDVADNGSAGDANNPEHRRGKDNENKPAIDPAPPQPKPTPPPPPPPPPPCDCARGAQQHLNMKDPGSGQGG